MIIVVDANILFSAMITPDSRIGEIIANPNSTAKMITCHYLFVELFKHQPKIIKYSKRSEEQCLETLHALLQNIEFYQESLIEKQYWEESYRITTGIDLYDVNYVALTLKTNGLLWTGDKKLTAHLNAMQFNKAVSTSQLYELLNIG